MNKFIVFEGIDASGKSTQINFLKKYLESKNIAYKYLHFPRTDSGIYGELIAKFLRGEFGNIQEVNPYLVALLYAGDRNDAKTTIINWLKKNYFVIVDRYIYSNIAFQCAKISNIKEKKKLKNWILFLEYDHNKIPKPDLSLFLDVPFEFTEKKLLERRVGKDRKYLQGQLDIHEQNLLFQKKVKDEYLKLVKEDKNFYLIDCKGKNNKILLPEEIFEKKIIEKLGIIRY